MRKNLFRGKNEHTGWAFGDLRNYEKNGAKAIFSHDLLHRIEVDPETAGQCSTVPDKNGVLMYEGDIVKGLFLFGMEIKAVVAFQDGAFGLQWRRGGVTDFSAFTSLCNITYEVIGNIHDNPELLEV